METPIKRGPTAILVARLPAPLMDGLTLEAARQSVATGRTVSRNALVREAVAAFLASMPVQPVANFQP